MRVVVSALTEHPTVWTITKCENTSPFGLQKLTLYTNFWNDHTDYVNLETGEMYADYFDSDIDPIDPDTPSLPSSSITAKISASTTSIKVGGSYKTLTVNLFNSNEDVTSEYLDATFNWICSIDDDDWTNKVTWRSGTSNNQTKVKFPPDMSQLGKILNVKCVITNGTEIIESTVSQFDLTE